MQSRSPVRMSSGPPSVNLTASVSPIELGRNADSQVTLRPTNRNTECGAQQSVPQQASAPVLMPAAV